jgi:hypothetical protein
MKQLAYLGKHRNVQIVLFEQMSEVHQGRGIVDSLTPQVESAKITKCGDVIQRLFIGRVGQVGPVGN